jgi:hypothetical protein
MKQMHRNLRLGLLALVPLIGCGVIARQGAHRPERLILGKWQVNTHTTIHFSGNGYFTETRKDELVDVLTGRYKFLSKDRLQLQVHIVESNGEDVVLGGSAGVTPVEMEMHIRGDEADVDADNMSAYYSAKWKRIK